MGLIRNRVNVKINFYVGIHLWFFVFFCSFLEKESLEDLLATLGQQIRNSDWLQQNTPEKFEEENPEIAQIFKNIASDTKAKGDGGQG